MVLPNTVIGLARPGADVPGYQGYISGKKPEADLLGGTFRADNEKAAKVKVDERTGRRDGAIPGYSGHVPGKLADVYGATFSASNLYASARREGEVRPGEPQVQPSQPVLGDHIERRGQQGAGHAIKAIPNYAGFIPSKKAENIISKSWRPANWEAAVEFGKTRSPATARGWRASPSVSTASSLRNASGQRPGTAPASKGSRSAHGASGSSGSLRGMRRPASSRSASHSLLSVPFSHGVYDYSKSGLPGRL